MTKEPTFGEAEYREVLQTTGISMSREMARKVWTAQQSKKPVTVYLHGVLTHNGTPYFAKMRWGYTSRNGHAADIYWVFKTYPGGSAPSWNVR